MLTLLSRTWRRIVDIAAGRAPAAAPAPIADSLALPAACAVSQAPALRVVGVGESPAANSDTPIRAERDSRKEVFLAGEGARLYSLDAFRAARKAGSSNPHAPRAA